jgi:hypothetical protein
MLPLSIRSACAVLIVLFVGSAASAQVGEPDNTVIGPTGAATSGPSVQSFRHTSNGALYSTWDAVVGQAEVRWFGPHGAMDCSDGGRSVIFDVKETPVCRPVYPCFEWLVSWRWRMAGALVENSLVPAGGATYMRYRQGVVEAFITVAARFVHPEFHVVGGDHFGEPAFSMVSGGGTSGARFTTLWVHPDHRGVSSFSFETRANRLRLLRGTLWGIAESATEAMLLLPQQRRDELNCRMRFAEGETDFATVAASVVALPFRRVAVRLGREIPRIAALDLTACTDTWCCYSPSWVQSNLHLCVDASALRHSVRVDACLLESEQ